MQKLIVFLLIVFCAFSGFPLLAETINDKGVQFRSTSDPSEGLLFTLKQSDGTLSEMAYIFFDSDYPEKYNATNDFWVQSSPNLGLLFIKESFSDIQDDMQLRSYTAPMRDNRNIQIRFFVPSADTYTINMTIIGKPI
jgi:hypothetical protein